MKKFKNILLINLIVLTVFFLAFNSSVSAAENLILYTPYTGLSVTPGDTIDYSIDYSIDVINNSNLIKNVSFKMLGLPEGWDYTITSAGDISRLAVKSKEFKNDNSESIKLKLDVPLQIQKGDYKFQLIATASRGQKYQLPLTVTVAEKGVFETEFDTDQLNMEGYSDSDFTYDLTLKNRTAEEQHYALTADASRGWDVRFKVSGDWIK